MRCSKKPSRSNLGLAFTPPPQKKRCPRFSYSQKVSTDVLESAILTGVGPYESCCSESGWKTGAPSAGRKKDASGSEQTATVKRTQAEAQNLKHGRSADPVSENHPVGYESRQYSGDLAGFMEL